MKFLKQKRFSEDKSVRKLWFKWRLGRLSWWCLYDPFLHKSQLQLKVFILNFSTSLTSVSEEARTSKQELSDFTSGASHPVQSLKQIDFSYRAEAPVVLFWSLFLAGLWFPQQDIVRTIRWYWSPVSYLPSSSRSLKNSVLYSTEPNVIISVTEEIVPQWAELLSYFVIW